MGNIDDLRSELIKETIACLDYGMVKIMHCAEQLNDQQIWWRSHDQMNAIGNLILHLAGNLRQWIIAGIGDHRDTRQREREFTERSSIPKEKLMSLLSETVSEASQTLRAMSAEDLLAIRTIQGYRVSKMQAMLQSVTHFQGHVQEIIHISREQLGDAYQFQWRPTTKEEGAPDLES